MASGFRGCSDHVLGPVPQEGSTQTLDPPQPGRQPNTGDPVVGGKAAAV